MAKLTFPVVRAGLAVPVLIGLDGQTATTLNAAGQPILPPILAKGLLDTATSVTSVASWVFQQLRLAPVGSGRTQTASSLVPVNLFQVSLSITDRSQPGSPWFTCPGLRVVELTTVLPDADVLVGLDVLLTCKLLVDGPARQFSLEF